MEANNTIRVFAPATVANVGSGFDILGLALNDPGDILSLQLKPTDGILISNSSGFELPLDAESNTAGISLKTMMKALGYKKGLHIHIEKKIRPGSGIGSSAASSAGAVFALNELLNRPFTSAELVSFAMEGERAASGVAHADNVAPALMGGMILVRSTEPLDLISLPFPESVYIAIVHPQITISTADSRAVLPKSVTLTTAVRQAANVSALVAGLYSRDTALIGRSMDDYFAEPHRTKLIPGYLEAKDVALRSGAIACSISGSGPSIFTFCHNQKEAENLINLQAKVFARKQIETKTYISKLNNTGCRVLPA